MGFKKRVPAAIVGKAKTRLAAMKQIDTDQGANVDYGTAADPLTQTEMDNQITDAEKKVNDYNQLLDQADTLGNKILAAEALVETSFARVLTSAKGKFGLDADEVEQLGGTRKSERKKPRRTPPPPAHP